ncbi:MAG: sigma-70 family RNA polymerase sigma factor [Gammaproteobacteria bacterium]|nr:sigma-70 family RNA polymerase sigma factor [Gammaproteobacteria bacterium]
MNPAREAPARQRPKRPPVFAASHYGRLLAFLNARLANEQDARELAQEAYLRLLRATRARLIEDPAAYLFRIARNLLYEWYVSLPPDSEPLSGSAPSADLAVEEQAALAQHMDRLEDALRQLSPKCRAVVLMHRRDGMTYKEIGAALGISASMVKKYLARGLASCRLACADFPGAER